MNQTKKTLHLALQLDVQQTIQAVVLYSLLNTKSCCDRREHPIMEPKLTVSPINALTDQKSKYRNVFVITLVTSLIKEIFLISIPFLWCYAHPCSVPLCPEISTSFFPKQKGKMFIVSHRYPEVIPGKLLIIKLPFLNFQSFWGYLMFS